MSFEQEVIAAIGGNRIPFIASPAGPQRRHRGGPSLRINEIRDAAQQVSAAIVEISSALQEQSPSSLDSARRLDGLATEVDQVISTFRV